MAEITTAELRELELRRSQDDLQTLLVWLREDGEIVVVDEVNEPADDEEDGDPSADADVPEPVFA